MSQENETVNFYYETNFSLVQESVYSKWIKSLIISEEKKLGEISYIFCDDAYLLDINRRFLDHDTYTDIISFDNSIGNILNGDIFISIDRVKENANSYDQDFDTELRRVMAHGLLHYCGYKDKSESDSLLMRQKEEEKMKLFHVEQL